MYQEEKDMTKCKDCKHHRVVNDSEDSDYVDLIGFCGLLGIQCSCGLGRDENDYCSKGERKHQGFAQRCFKKLKQG